jgi:hypothetical protein
LWRLRLLGMSLGIRLFERWFGCYCISDVLGR